jgi:predicted amidohydrolase YtcJ
MKIYEGTILACDKEYSQWKYLVEHKGRILYTGNELPGQYQKGERIKLGSKALLPSFGDGHIHFSNWAMVAVAQFDVREQKSIREIQSRIATERKRQRKPKVMIGFGISKHNLEEKRLITRKELDLAVSDTPLILIGYDGHSSICNTKMQELFPKEYHSLRGFNEDSGQLFYEAYLRTLDYATSLVPTLSLIKSILKAYDKLAEYGVGIIHAVEGIGFPGDADVTLVSLAAKAIARKTGLQTRIFFQTMDLKKVEKRKLPRVGGCFATALDGCFGACDAALLEPYSNDSSNKGILFHDPEEFNAFVLEAHRKGIQMELHCIGDAAVKRAVNAFEIALNQFPREDHRHTLIHACLIEPEDLDKIEKLGLGITLQPSFLSSPLEPLSYLKEILGDRALSGSPYREFIDRSIPLSGGSDGPVTPPDPIEGISCCVEHPYDSSQAISMEEALAMYTQKIYHTTFDDNRGVLKEGNWADMVILDRNPLENRSKELAAQIKVEQLLLRGKPYKKGMSVFGMIFRGLFGKQVII